ncbi:MAG: hypothetical protein R2788_22680 [Saprospiraceae bacterium]
MQLSLLLGKRMDLSLNEKGLNIAELISKARNWVDHEHGDAKKFKAEDRNKVLEVDCIILIPAALEKTKYMLVMSNNNGKLKSLRKQLTDQSLRRLKKCY